MVLCASNELLGLGIAPLDELGVSGSPAKIVWRADLAAINVDSGDAKLGDGSTIQSDQVIDNICQMTSGLLLY